MKLNVLIRDSTAIRDGGCGILNRLCPRLYPERSDDPLHLPGRSRPEYNLVYSQRFKIRFLKKSCSHLEKSFFVASERMHGIGNFFYLNVFEF